MIFTADLKRFTVQTRTRAQVIYEGAAAATLKSIKFGSSLTGAPGQPVDSGDLRASWTATPESATTTLITHDKAYAQSNEDGIARPGGGPYRLRSKVGGRWSVKLTVMHFDRLVQDIAQKLGTRR